jgi:phage virion morphogenesis protein
MAGANQALTFEDLASEHFRQLSLRATSTGQLHARLGEYLLRSTRRRFETQTDPQGSPWQPLSPRTLRGKKYNRDKILTLRGYLRRGIRYQVQDGRAVLVGTNLRYAAAKQFGNSFVVNAHSRVQRYRSVAGRLLFAGKRHKRVIEKRVTTDSYMVNEPARPFLGVSDADRAEILRIIEAWLDEQGK